MCGAPRRGVVILLLAALAAPAVLHALWPGASGPVLRTVSVGQMPGMVAVDEHTARVFVTNSANDTVSVLDARSGAVLHTVSLGREPDVVHTDARTGRAFVISADNALLVLDAASGALLRTVVGCCAGELAVDEHTARVVMVGAPADLRFGAVMLVDGRSGAIVHQDTTVGPAVWGAALDGGTGRAFVPDLDGNVVDVVDLSSGQVLCTVAVGERPVNVAVDAATGQAFVANNGADTLTMLDARSGTVRRTIKVGPNPSRVVVDERSARVFVVHGRGGPRYNTYQSLAPFGLIGTSGLTVLDARSGAVLRSLAVGGSPLDDVGYVNAYNLAVDQRRGRVFVINQTAAAALNGPAPGSVSVLDARSGRLLGTVVVGRHPVALAVDETSARLFVVNTNSGCLRPVSIWAHVPSAVRRVLPFLPGPPAPTCHLAGSVTVIDTTRV